MRRNWQIGWYIFLSRFCQSSKRLPHLPPAVISRYHDNVTPWAPPPSACLAPNEFCHRGRKWAGGGGGGVRAPSQSPQLQLRNPVGWCCSYFILGKDYLSAPEEMYWSVFPFFSVSNHLTKTPRSTGVSDARSRLHPSVVDWGFPVTTHTGW